MSLGIFFAFLFRAIYPIMGSWRKSQFSLLFPKFIFFSLSKFPRDLFEPLSFLPYFPMVSSSYPISIPWGPFSFSLPSAPPIHSPLPSKFFILPPFPPPKFHGSLLSYPAISALSIHSPPKFFIAPFPNSLGLENKISPLGSSELFISPHLIP